jgi:hypothetical protein
LILVPAKLPALPAYDIATVEGVMHGLYVRWWVQQEHVSVAAVAAILAAGDLFVTVLELVTSIEFLDNAGRAVAVATLERRAQAVGVLSFHLYAITHEHMRTRVVKLNSEPPRR